MGQSSVSCRGAMRALGLPGTLDVTAGRTGERVFFHVVKTQRTRFVKSAFRTKGKKIAGDRVHWFDLDPGFEVFEHRPECVSPKEKTLNVNLAWTFPRAYVSAVELTVEPAW